MKLKKDTTISHYKILSSIGKGGMGEVFLAQDTKLDRKVAIKFLGQEFSKDADKLNRFIQEAKAASALNHPNILTIYEIGETDDTNYIVTEYIEGKTLRESLSQKETLQLNAILKIGVQVSEALSAAHQAGIAHRDIKPENVMIRPDGFVKILDFGLAKLIEQENKSSINLEAETRRQNQTANGVIMGTVNYMSPEQAKGKKVDEKTDIFSFGVVLYEMITGRNPFASETTNETIAAILKSEQSSLSSCIPNIPPKLERIVSKTLRKDPKKRYQNIIKLLIDLQEVKQELEFEAKLEQSIQPNLDELENETTASYNQDSVTKIATTAEQQNILSAEYITSGIKKHKYATLAVLATLVIAIATFGYFKYFALAPPITSVAVLPFENASGDANLDYLSDGLSESLIDKLSQLPQLKVIARNSSFEFRGENIDIQDVADKLGVQAIVMGEVVQVGEDLTIRVEMIDARENKQIWGERYDRKAVDIVSVQNEILHTVSEKLRRQLTDNQETQLAKRGTTNPEALRLYMKGKLTLSQNIKNGNFLSALKYFEQANALDPDFALPYVEIASIYQRAMWWSLMDPQIAKSKAKASFQKAFEIDPTLPAVYAGLANIDFFEFNFSKAEREFKKAIELNPNFTRSYGLYSVYLSRLGRHEEALENIKKLQSLDPMSQNAWKVEEGHCLTMAGRYDDAITLLQDFLQIEPKDDYAHWVLGNTYTAKGMYKEAIESFKKAIEVSKEVSRGIRIYLGEAYAKAGETNKARAILKDMETTREYVSPAELAILYAALGDKDKAFQTLEQAYAAKDFQLVNLNIDLGYDSLRDDPRFKDLVRRVGLPQ